MFQNGTINIKDFVSGGGVGALNRKKTRTQGKFEKAWILGCLKEDRINGDRINGLFHLLINGIYWGYNPFYIGVITH